MSLKGSDLRERGRRDAGRVVFRIAEMQTAVARGRSASGSLRDDEDVRQGQILRVGQRQERRGAAYRVQPPSRTAMKLQLRRSAAPDDFDVAPEHPPRMAGPERFHRRFFRGKPRREVRAGPSPVEAIRDLAIGKHPFQEPLAEPVDGLFDAGDLRGVKSCANDSHGASSDSVGGDYTVWFPGAPGAPTRILAWLRRCRLFEFPPALLNLTKPFTQNLADASGQASYRWPSFEAKRKQQRRSHAREHGWRDGSHEPVQPLSRDGDDVMQVDDGWFL